jgi:predicted O-linked N-acetylglucosamine transferase (SPINDLY family)
VCSNLAAYEELAVALAEDTDKLYGMRQHLERCRENCAAFDTARWVVNVEKGLKKVWEVSLFVGFCWQCSFGII